jgi:probable phosphoglycerate mutase
VTPRSDPREIWLVRHAETEWSRDHRHTGRTDVPLLDEGRAAARRLPDRLSGVEFSAVFVSPLHRARETCELAGFGDRMQLEEGLLEWDYGDYEGLSTEQVRAERPAWYLWRDGCPGGEGPDEIARRVDGVIDRALGTEGNVALFAHGHVLRALGARWIEQPVATGGRLGLSTAAVCVLGFEREVRAIRRWNDAG